MILLCQPRCHTARYRQARSTRASHSSAEQSIVGVVFSVNGAFICSPPSGGERQFCKSLVDSDAGVLREARDTTPLLADVLREWLPAIPAARARPVCSVIDRPTS